MAEDWDLYAVVRSCKSATNTAIAAKASAATEPLKSSVARAVEDDPLSCLASLKFEDESDDPFSFPNLVGSRANGFQELQQFYKPFVSNPTTTTTTTSTSSHGIVPDSSSISEFGGRSSGQHDQVRQFHDSVLPANNAVNRPLFSPESYISGFGGFIEDQEAPQQDPKTQTQQRHEEARGDHQQGLTQRPETSLATTSLPTGQSQTPRSRKRYISLISMPKSTTKSFVLYVYIKYLKFYMNFVAKFYRKSQQKRMVCHVTAENLSGDLWAWRKYGQKPIKGSPYPRSAAVFFFFFFFYWLFL